MSGFLKSFPAADDAREAARRANDLAALGVATPTARLSGGRDVSFRRIDGVSGLRLAQRPPEEWLRPLTGLHRARLAGAAAYDPILRIRPRVHLISHSGVGAALERLGGGAPLGGALLHGDFHLGQLVRSVDGAVWIIDLDDLATGPPDADIGNLIANLATQPELGGTFEDRLTRWRATIISCWRVVGGEPELPALDRFIALALIRRHLKLREAGREDFETEIARVVTSAADRISPSGSGACPD